MLRTILKFFAKLKKDTLETEFLETLKELENAGKLGYDPNTNTWTPHRSIEGGTPTIGYGHKLNRDEAELNYVEVDGERYSLSYPSTGIDDELVERLFEIDWNKARDLAEAQWNSKYSTALFFSQLPKKYQLVLSEIVFNIGTLVRGSVWQWSKLAQAILNGQDHLVSVESQRSYKNPVTGEMIPLTNRHKALMEVLDLA